MTLTDELTRQRRKVDFDTYDISVQQLLSMVSDRTIDIAPEYQRHFRWDQLRQSQLVESVFLGIPVPSMFMATTSDNTWEVVDGVQRLSTLIRYAGDAATREIIGMDYPLRIQGLAKLYSLNGLTFSEVPKNIQVQFLLRPLKVVTLSDKSDSVVRFDLFERLNTGGVRLSDQEIRACVFRSEFNEFLGDLAHQDDFLTAVHLPPARRNDRTDEECVLRFFAFLYRYKVFKHSVVDFLNEYMRSAMASFDFHQNRELFRETFRFLAKTFPAGISRPGRKSTPVNLFEAVAVGAGLALLQNKHIQRPRSLDWVVGEELKALTTGATNTQPMVSGRIEYCAQHFGWTEDQ